MRGVTRFNGQTDNALFNAMHLNKWFTTIYIEIDLIYMYNKFVQFV